MQEHSAPFIARRTRRNESDASGRCDWRVEVVVEMNKEIVWRLTIHEHRVHEH
jgi:hypothetical protein